MTYLIITVAVLAFTEIITLTFFGKGSRKKEEIKPVFVFESWEVKAKHYDDAIKALDAMKG